MGQPAADVGDVVEHGDLLLALRSNRLRRERTREAEVRELRVGHIDRLPFGADAQAEFKILAANLKIGPMKPRLFERFPCNQQGDARGPGERNRLGTELLQIRLRRANLALPQGVKGRRFQQSGEPADLAVGMGDHGTREGRPLLAHRGEQTRQRAGLEANIVVHHPQMGHPLAIAFQGEPFAEGEPAAATEIFARNQPRDLQARPRLLDDGGRRGIVVVVDHQHGHRCGLGFQRGEHPRQRFGPAVSGGDDHHQRLGKGGRGRAAEDRGGQNALGHEMADLVAHFRPNQLGPQPGQAIRLGEPAVIKAGPVAAKVAINQMMDCPPRTEPIGTRRPK